MDDSKNSARADAWVNQLTDEQIEFAPTKLWNYSIREKYILFFMSMSFLI